MCDYSLMHYKARDAAVDDVLTVHRFPSASKGFISAGDTETAVCVRPGTEIAFNEDIVEQKYAYMLDSEPTVHQTRVGRFRQIDTDKTHVHHDAIELVDGKIIKLQDLKEGQNARVLQLPAAPQNETEAKEQQRLEVVA